MVQYSKDTNVKKKVDAIIGIVRLCLFSDYLIPCGLSVPRRLLLLLVRGKVLPQLPARPQPQGGGGRGLRAITTGIIAAERKDNCKRCEQSFRDDHFRNLCHRRQILRQFIPAVNSHKIGTR
jgi:hypothetical protein